jgi:hypothetical protein
MPFLVAGGATAGVGVLALAAGGVLTGVALSDFNTAKDLNTFQDDAKKSLDAANATGVTAAILIPVGAVLAVGGGIVLALNLGE